MTVSHLIHRYIVITEGDNDIHSGKTVKKKLGSLLTVSLCLCW